MTALLLANLESGTRTRNGYRNNHQNRLAVAQVYPNYPEMIDLEPVQILENWNICNDNYIVNLGSGEYLAFTLPDFFQGSDERVWYSTQDNIYKIYIRHHEMTKYDVEIVKQ